MLVGGRGDQMDMVGHEAIPKDAHPGADGVVGRKMKIELAVVVGGGHGLPIVASLCDVVRDIRHHDSWTAGHMRRVPDGQSVSREKCVRHLFVVTFSSSPFRLRLTAEMALRLALALDVTTDELLRPGAPKPGKKPSRRVLRRLESIEKLPPGKQTVLLRTIDTFLENAALKSARR